MICNGRVSSYKAPKLVVINSGKKIPRGLRAARGKKRGTAGCVAAKSVWGAPQKCCRASGGLLRAKNARGEDLVGYGRFGVEDPSVDQSRHSGLLVWMVPSPHPALSAEAIIVTSQSAQLSLNTTTYRPIPPNSAVPHHTVSLHSLAIPYTLENTNLCRPPLTTPPYQSFELCTAFSDLLGAGNFKSFSPISASDWCLLLTSSFFG